MRSHGRFAFISGSDRSVQAHINPQCASAARAVVDNDGAFP